MLRDGENVSIEHPWPSRSLPAKAAASGRALAELGADFCLHLVPRSEMNDGILSSVNSAQTLEETQVHSRLSKARSRSLLMVRALQR